MAFQDVLDKIANDIIDNTDRLITPAVLRGVLNDIAQWAQDYKVDKVAGKGLSEEDFTTTLLNKLNGIEPGAQVNEVSAADLADKISKDFGIELEANKVAKFFNGDMDTLTDTGIYRGGYNVINKPPSSDSRDYYFVIKQSEDFVIQLSFTFSNNIVSRRNKVSGSWSSWIDFLDTTDKTELQNLIEAKQSTSEKGQPDGYASLNSDGKIPEAQMPGNINLSIEDIDLSDPAIWTPSTKTLDLSTKEGVGIINFNTPVPYLPIVNISSSEIAKVTIGSNVDLIQNGTRIQFNGIQGQQVFTQLNLGTYMAMNVDYQNKTFDIRKGDNSGWIDTSFNFIVDILDISSSPTAQVTVANGDSISENQEIKIMNAAGMEDLWGNTYYVVNLDPGAGTFDLSTTEGFLTPVDTSGHTYQQNGILVEDSIYSPRDGSFVNFENDNVVIEIDSIAGVDNGRIIKFTANANNQIEFNKKSFASASANDIVGSESLILEENKILELLRNKNLNWMKSEFEAS